MRSTIIAAAFAVGAFAVPYHNHNHQKRQVVVTQVEYDVVYTTDIVTVTATGQAPQASPQNKQHVHHGHHQFGGNPGSSPSPNSPAVQNSPANNSPTPNPPAQAAPSSSQAPQPSPTQGNSGNGVSGGNGNSNGNGNGNGNCPSATDSSPDASYSDIVVYHHNIHRCNHTAPNIAWNQSLANTAADIAASCVYAHNVDMNGGGYGQNIAAGVEGNNISAVITDLFYNGEVANFDGYYGDANPPMGNFDNWGHFSQIVWKDTLQVGCYTQDCSGKGLQDVGSDVSPYFTVCNYYPPGNYGGEYGENIDQPIGEPTAQWNTGLY